MANCSTYNGILKDTCIGQNSGGIKNVWLMNKSNIVSVTPSILADSDIDVTDISVLDPKQGFKKYQSAKYTASATETAQVTDTNVSTSHKQEVVMKFAKNETAKRKEVAFLYNAETVALIEDQNGELRLFGENNGLTPSAGSNATGLKLADENAYNITLSDESPTMARFVNITGFTLDVEGLHPIVPTFVSGSVATATPTKVHVVFTKPMKESTFVIADFVLTQTTAKTISTIELDPADTTNSTLLFTVSAPLVTSTAINLAYTKGSLKSIYLGEVATNASMTITNNI